MAPVSARDTEEWASGAVVEALTSEGFCVSVLGRPDQQNLGRRAPDFELSVDRRRVGLEVTEFHIAGQRTRSRREGRAIELAIKASVDPLITSLGLPGAVASVRFDDLPSRSQLRKETPIVIQAVRDAVIELGGTPRVEVVTGLAWVRELELVRIDNDGHLGFIATHGLGYALAAAAEEFLERTVQNKASQVVDYPTSILAIVRGIEVGADLLGTVASGYTDLPWTRVYAVASEQVELIYDADFASTVEAQPMIEDVEPGCELLSRESE